MKVITRSPSTSLNGLLALFGSGLLSLLLMQNACAAVTVGSVKNAYDVPVLHPAIPILDEQGKNVLETGNPYSPKKTCEGSGCHDYEKITHAFHFEMGRDEADDNYGKKRGIPHLVSPGYFGGYNCMGANSPSMMSSKNNASANDFKDYGGPDMIKVCQNCHMGGGYEEKDRDNIRYDQKNVADIKPFDGDYYQNMTSYPATPAEANKPGDYNTRLKLWDYKKTGVVEADCMTCHTDLKTMRKFPESLLGKNDLSDKSQAADVQWATLRNTNLIKKDFFREAGTAIFEFIDLKPNDPNGLQLVNFAKTNIKLTGTVTNGVTATTDSYDLVLGANGKPKINWNPKAFDANGKVVIPMMRFTPPENCMQCHLTANSRRGFYGFGDKSRMEEDEANGGTYKNDYYDDVHKGTVYTDLNGETRAIENCNSCHAKNYYNPPFKSPELSLDHNFLKGNSDMDLRNDLDYAPPAKSCQLCHQDVPNPVIPSGHKTLLEAHLSAWANSGNLTGYPKERLNQVAKTHMDKITCETCHIVGLQTAATTKLQPMYRYKVQEDGVRKIAAYNSTMRSLWRDRKGDMVIPPYVLKMVYKDVPAATGQPVTQTQIINVMDGSVLATIGKTGAAYDSPRTYEQFVALKTAYDKLMEKRGYKGADMQLVYGEANTYTLNHGTRPSAQALDCESCHEKTGNGSWSETRSDKRLLGSGNVKVFTTVTVPDPKLVTEGYIRFEQPYIKLNSKNQLTINAADLLNVTEADPFLTIAKNTSAKTITGELKAGTLAEAMTTTKMVDDPLRQSLAASFGKNPVYYFKNAYGDVDLENIGVVGLGGRVADVLLPLYRFTMDVYRDLPTSLVSLFESKVPGSKLGTSVYWFNARDRDLKTVGTFVEPMYVKLPYKGTATAASKVRVLNSLDGSVINQLSGSAILDVKPQTATQQGYILFQTTQFGWFAALELK